MKVPINDENKDSASNNYASLLFGNIDSNGLLEDDFLDEECKRGLGYLTKAGLQPILEDVIGDDHAKSFNELNLEGDESDFNVKSPSALDYWDISEVATENTFLNPDNANYDESRSVSYNENKGVLKVEPSNEACSARLVTPLAAMLPSKYAGIPVTELFPDFRPNKVLRFSKLFGLGKMCSLPKTWHSVRKRRKRKKLSSEVATSEIESAGWKMSYEDVSPTPSMVGSDDEEKFLQPVEVKVQEEKKEEEVDDFGPKAVDWRFGPAQLWYDMLNVAETGDGFDYGFKLKQNVQPDNKEDEEDDEDAKANVASENKTSGYCPDAFLMISQLNWEDDIIWDGDEIKDKVLQNLERKANAAGWLPSSSNRTAQTFSQPGKGLLSPLASGGTLRFNANQPINVLKPVLNDQDDTWYSIFPVENEELVYGTWEDDIIWDHEQMTKLPKPKILTLDPNDDNIILGIPEDADPSKTKTSSSTPIKVKIPHPHVKKSKLILGKAGVINVLEDDEEPPPPPSQSPDHDPFNISGDRWYMPRLDKKAKAKCIVNVIQHSIPVVELRAPFVQTQMGPMRLRNFHRHPLKRFSHGALAHPGPHPVIPLHKHIKKVEKLREQERLSSGGGEMFFMRTPEDLTGRDGSLLLIELSEEHPPLINQVGMCSKIKTYYKRTSLKDDGPTHLKYGELVHTHSSPFLGSLAPGQYLQVVENNMYRAPLYEQSAPETDFLVIRTRHQYFIREFQALFVAGQQCPLYEVPSPNSKLANIFVKDFLQVFIYRLFWKSKDTPKKIRMDDVRKAFPSHSESSLRKRLKMCADFRRTGNVSNWWVLKTDFRLPPEDEIRTMVSPEQCCAYFSMIAAEQRLKDAGYGEKSFLNALDEDDEELQVKMDDEIKVAPWNTTRAYILATKGKCLLQLTGPGDPTGCGEGFSYIRVPNKPTLKQFREESNVPKRMVTGTDADLRRLSLNNAKALLRKSGVPEEEIKKLTRWEVIDVVRTLSTEKAKAGEEGMTKFSRGNRFSVAEHQERYKEECQRIFELQNKVLSSREILSSDEGESSDEGDGSDMEEMGKNIENILANKKTSTQVTLEREEQERKALRKMIMGEEVPVEKPKVDKKRDDEVTANTYKGRLLKIYRTYQDQDGNVYTRMEVVRKPAVIDAYLKIRNCRDDTFIIQYAIQDEAQREEMKREKRRIQEQLRRIKKNQEKELSFIKSRPLSAGIPQSRATFTPVDDSSVDSKDSLKSLKSSGIDSPSSPSSSKHVSFMKKQRGLKAKQDLKMKCGACGNYGHIRTNRACPLYNQSGNSLNVAMTEEQEQAIEKELGKEECLVNVEGTKVKLSSKLIKHSEDMKRKSQQGKVPKEPGSKKKRKNASEDLDYLAKHQKTVTRRCTDPLIALQTILESILNDLRAQPDVQPFLFPVNTKDVPDYYKIVTNPMDLQTMRDNLRQKKYHTRADFLADVNQIVENSTIYNGSKSPLTFAAQKILQVCVTRFSEKEEKLMRLEKAINPLLDDNDQVALSFILDNCLSSIKLMKESYSFQKPVDRKVFKDYYQIVSEPIDLEIIGKNITSHKYHSRYEFLADFDLLKRNCVLYNGQNAECTQQAMLLEQKANEILHQYDEHLSTLESKIKIVQDQAQKEEREGGLSWLGPDDDQLNEFPESPVMDVGVDSDDGIPKVVNIKTETRQLLLADDLNCSSEDEMDEDDMEEVKVEAPLQGMPAVFDELDYGSSFGFYNPVQPVAQHETILGNDDFVTSDASSDQKQYHQLSSSYGEGPSVATTSHSYSQVENQIEGKMADHQFSGVGKSFIHGDLQLSDDDDDEEEEGRMDVSLKKENADGRLW